MSMKEKKAQEDDWKAQINKHVIFQNVKYKNNSFYCLVYTNLVSNQKYNRTKQNDIKE